MKTAVKKLTSLLLCACFMLAILAGTVSAYEFRYFDDVTEDDWYYEYVDRARANCLMLGVAPRTFLPGAKLTRAMAVTVLMRYYSPNHYDAVNTDHMSNPFRDVKEGKWYTDAVKWAAEFDIVRGRGDGLFDPEAYVTRAELCTMLDRYLQFDLLVLKENVTDTMNFKDIADVPRFASDAMEKLYRAGVIKGTDMGTLEPLSAVTRAEAAVLFGRLSLSVTQYVPESFKKMGYFFNVHFYEDRMLIIIWPDGNYAPYERLFFVHIGKENGEWDVQSQYFSVKGKVTASDGLSVEVDFVFKHLNGEYYRFEPNDASNMILQYLAIEENDIVTVEVTVTAGDVTETVRHYIVHSVVY